MAARRGCLCGLLLVATLGLCGQPFAAHITDKLVVGLYPRPASDGVEPVRLLSSGTPLEVLATQAAFVQVRLADQMVGWVEAAYVTEEKPARAILLETQARLRVMGLELAALREQQAQTDGSVQPTAVLPPSAREAQLRQSLAQTQRRVAELESQLVEGRAGEQAQRRISELERSQRQAIALLTGVQGLDIGEAQTAPAGILGSYLTWIAGGLGLLVGFLAGFGFVDYRIRKRYGGFRI